MQWIQDDSLLEWNQFEKSIVLSAPLFGCLFSLPFYLWVDLIPSLEKKAIKRPLF